VYVNSFLRMVLDLRYKFSGFREKEDDERKRKRGEGHGQQCKTIEFYNVSTTTVLQGLLREVQPENNC
jgi:hypothetical protein